MIISCISYWKSEKARHYNPKALMDSVHHVNLLICNFPIQDLAEPKIFSNDWVILGVRYYFPKYEWIHPFLHTHLDTSPCTEKDQQVKIICGHIYTDCLPVGGTAGTRCYLWHYSFDLFLCIVILRTEGVY